MGRADDLEDALCLSSSTFQVGFLRVHLPRLQFSSTILVYIYGTHTQTYGTVDAVRYTSRVRSPRGPLPRGRSPRGPARRGGRLPRAERRGLRGGGGGGGGVEQRRRTASGCAPPVTGQRESNVRRARATRVDTGPSDRATQDFKSPVRSTRKERYETRARRVPSAHGDEGRKGLERLCSRRRKCAEQGAA